MNKTLSELIANRYLAFVFRLYIGGVFVYASLYKINYPGEFAETIASYQILPHMLIGLVAVVLPWLELVCAALLILGIRAKAAALVLAVLLSIFLLAILVNLIREAPISCGCFHSLEDELSWRTFFRDVAWLLMTIHILLYDRVWLLERRFTTCLKEVAEQ
jgi:putative oxidoreductase